MKINRMLLLACFAGFVNMNAQDLYVLNEIKKNTIVDEKKLTDDIKKEKDSCDEKEQDKSDKDTKTSAFLDQYNWLYFALCAKSNNSKIRLNNDSMFSGNCLLVVKDKGGLAGTGVVEISNQYCWLSTARIKDEGKDRDVSWGINCALGLGIVMLGFNFCSLDKRQIGWAYSLYYCGNVDSISMKYDCDKRTFQEILAQGLNSKSLEGTPVRCAITENVIKGCAMLKYKQLDLGVHVMYMSDGFTCGRKKCYQRIGNVEYYSSENFEYSKDPEMKESDFKVCLDISYSLDLGRYVDKLKNFFIKIKVSADLFKVRIDSVSVLISTDEFEIVTDVNNMVDALKDDGKSCRTKAKITYAETVSKLRYEAYIDNKIEFFSETDKQLMKEYFTDRKIDKNKFDKLKKPNLFSKIEVIDQSSGIDAEYMENVKLLNSIRLDIRNTKDMFLIGWLYGYGLTKGIPFDSIGLLLEDGRFSDKYMLGLVDFIILSGKTIYEWQ